MNHNPSASTPTTPTFGEFLRALRKARGIGLVELAHTARVDPGLLSRFENGRRIPSRPAMLQQIATALDIASESKEFEHLVNLFNRARAAKLEAETILDRAMAEEDPFELPAPVLCQTVAEMVGLVAEYVITTGAMSINVLSKSGAVLRRWQVLTAQKSRSDAASSLVALAHDLAEQKSQEDE